MTEKRSEYQIETPEPNPADVLARLLALYTLDQLDQIAACTEELKTRSGFGQVIIFVKASKPRFIGQLIEDEFVKPRSYWGR